MIFVSVKYAETLFYTKRKTLLLIWNFIILFVRKNVKD